MDDYHIMSLIKMGIPGIYIREGEDDDLITGNIADMVVIAPRYNRRLRKKL